MQGFSLLEVTVSMAILATLALMLMGMIVASQRLTTASRERSVALQAVRDYIDSMRSKTDTAIILDDLTTPVDFLPSPNPLTSATGEVCKMTFEAGTGGTKVSGPFGSAATTTSLSGFTDATSLAMPCDINGDGTTTGSPAGTSSLLVLPMRVSLTWTSSVLQSQTVTAYVYFGKP